MSSAPDGAEISRANAQHSTGPKTPEGKQRVSLNASLPRHQEKAAAPNSNRNWTITSNSWKSKNRKAKPTMASFLQKKQITRAQHRRRVSEPPCVSMRTHARQAQYRKLTLSGKPRHRPPPV
jgi:hypothetical protein